jgi:hypothetical protein
MPFPLVQGHLLQAVGVGGGAAHHTCVVRTDQHQVVPVDALLERDIAYACLATSAAINLPGRKFAGDAHTVCDRW